MRGASATLTQKALDRLLKKLLKSDRALEDKYPIIPTPPAEVEAILAKIRSKKCGACRGANRKCIQSERETYKCAHCAEHRSGHVCSWMAGKQAFIKPPVSELTCAYIEAIFANLGKNPVRTLYEDSDGADSADASGEADDEGSEEASDDDAEQGSEESSGDDDDGADGAASDTPAPSGLGREMVDTLGQIRDELVLLRQAVQARHAEDQADG